jgi:3-deoxy-D-manno-octulosonic-acid transferase
VYLLYSVVLAALFVLSLPVYAWKGRGTGKYLQTFRERMGRLPASLNAGRERSIWIHAVSVGEVLAARTLVKPLRERFPGHRLFVSTTTVAGNGVARSSLPDVDGLFFAPFDWVRPVRRALDALNPALLVLVETELWPNLIHEARRRGTRVAVVNGRISPRSFPRYRRVRALLKTMLGEVDLFLMQGEAHAARVRQMGAPPDRVRVLGNLKYDAPEEVMAPESLAESLGSVIGDGSRPLWVAGSTVEGEEEIVLRAYGQVRDRVPQVRLLIAPRHPERFGAVPGIVEAAGLRCLRRTSLRPGGWPDGHVVVLDTLGELARVYPLATVVFVGGSLVPRGGHNILEAAVAGKPVVVGPHMENFQEIADEFVGAGAVVQVPSGDALAAEVSVLLTDAGRRAALGEKARLLVHRNRGALRTTVDALAALVA